MIRYNKVIKLSRSIECITIYESLFMTHTYSAIYVKILAFKINFRTIHEKFNVGNQAWVTKMIKKDNLRWTVLYFSEKVPN